MLYRIVRAWSAPVFVFAMAGLSVQASAASPADAQGLWLSAQKDAVLEFKPCDDQATALCGRIVWDKDAGTPAAQCGVVVARLDRFDRDAWRDGWVFDPRDRKKYRGALRVKEGDLHIRAYIGNEMLGQTEQLSRVTALPASPRCGS